MSDELPRSEITVLQLVDTVLDFFWYILKKWYWFIVAIFLGGGVFYYKYISFEPDFTGRTEFVIEAQDGASDLTGGVLGKLGLGGKSGINSNRVVKITRSKSILRNVLVRPVVLGQDTMMMVDLVLDSSRLALYLEENKQLAAITIDSAQQITEASDRDVNLLVDFIHRSLSKEDLPFLLVEYDEDAEVFSLGVESQNELLSYELSKAIFEEIEEFYTDKFNSNQVDYYHSLKNRVDSIYAEQQIAQFRLLRLKDQSDGLYLQADRAKELRLQQEVQRLNGVYAELFRNLNQAEFSISNLQPVVVVIDRPALPLEKSQFNILVQFLLHVGGLVFLLLGVLFILYFWKMLKKVDAG